MNVLTISNTPWSDDNSFGNSFSNIFAGIPNLKFANIYCRPGVPHNQLDMIYFQITEKSLLRNLKNKNCPSGKVIEPEKESSVEVEALSGFEQGRKMRWQIMFWARDLIWKLGRWCSPDLKKFIDDFQPDIIFQPVYYSSYITEIALFAKRYTGKPMLGYISDDCYTLHQFSLSPLYWIDRLHKRKKVKAVIEQCEVLYVISDIQKQEYEKLFTPPCKILTKCADFSQEAPEWTPPKDGIKMMFAGNIGTGRWQSLALISNAVERLTQEGHKIQFEIYTPTPLTEKMKTALHKQGTTLHKPVPYDEILKLQKETDILVHAEGLSLKSRMQVHQSFSTKLVDFFAMGKCIFAIGTEDEASIAHLMANDAAVTAGSKEEAYQKLKELCANPEMMHRYGVNAYECGRKHHDRAYMQTMVAEDLTKAAGIS